MSLPIAPNDALAHRSARKFSVSGLNSREELVLKSFIRLLDHRTQHAWQYAPLTAELCFVAEGAKQSQLQLQTQQVQQPQQILTLGTNSSNRLGYLQMPLRAHELEAELNRLGVLIVPQNQAVQPSLDAPSTVPDKSLEIQPMRMLRWPPLALLKAPGRMRLATLMTGQQMTVYNLQQSSGESLAECRAFFDELRAANLLAAAPGARLPPQAGAQIVTPASPPPQQNKTSTSLISRIRKRLGIQIDNPSNHKGGA